MAVTTGETAVGVIVEVNRDWAKIRLPSGDSEWVQVIEGTPLAGKEARIFYDVAQPPHGLYLKSKAKVIE